MDPPGLLSNADNGLKAGHKPGSVHASQRLVCRGWVVIYLGPPLPTASSGAFKRNGANGQPSFLGLAPSRGLPSQHLSMLLVRSYRTFAPLPVPGGIPTGPSAVCFCGTLLTVTRTGRYPASLAIREPGLSSADTQRDRPQPPRLLSAHIMPRGHNQGRSGAVAQPDRATVS